MEGPSDPRAHRQGDEGRPRAVPRGRRVGVHLEAGRHRPTRRAHPRLAQCRRMKALSDRAETALSVKAAPEPEAPPLAVVTPPGAGAHADLELQLLFEAVYRVSGFDFREYAPATVKRRVADRVRAEGVATITGLLERVLHDPPAMARFVDALTHNGSSPFREPA